MAKLTRQQQQIFAGQAPSDMIAAFGTTQTGTPVYSTDLSTLQTTNYQQGWQDAIIADKAPFLEEMNGVQYGLSYQIAYNQQMGIPEWLNTQDYYTNSCAMGSDGNIYKSLTDDNVGNNPILDDGTNWVNILKTIETELNNPFTLFDSKYSEAPLYNVSWLLSNGTYYAKSVYVTAYEALVVENNSSVEAGDSVTLPSGGTYVKRGLSVKLSTDEDITDYDFVINTSNETFRLPVKVKQKFFSGDVPVVGNGIALGLTDGSKNAGLYGASGNSPNFLTSSISLYGTNTGTSPEGTNRLNQNKSLGVTTDPTKSGLIAKLSSAEVSGLYLYFYVGETVQNANLINAGRIEEKLVGKLEADHSNDTQPYITETFHGEFSNVQEGGANWYRIWSDGFIEQGGYVAPNATRATVSFLVPYKHNNTINVQVSESMINHSNNDTGGYQDHCAAQNITVNNFYVSCQNRIFNWRACGY